METSIKEKTGRDINGKFISGYMESPDLKLKRIQSFTKSWKDRSDYIKDIKHPYIYNVWRSFKFTQKGKKIGCESKWNNYRDFYNDVFSSYIPGLSFQRIDKTLPFASDNFIWVPKEVAPSLRNNTILLEYKGETLSLTQWSIKLNYSSRGMAKRYRKMIAGEYSIEEVLFGKKRIKKPKTNAYDLGYQKLRDKASKMCSSYRIKDQRKKYKFDLTLEWLINNILFEKCVYCGTKEHIGCDRIDNKKGHTTDNVVPCCSTCNTIRGDNFTVMEMQLLGNVVAEIRSKRIIDKN